jgi:hypothetical protein
LSTSFTAILPRTEDKHKELLSLLDTRPQLSLGVPVELWQESPELVVQEPTELDKEPLETCVEVVICTLLSRSGEDGTERPTRTKRDTLLPQPLLPLPLHLLFLPEDTELSKSQSFLLSLKRSTLTKLHPLSRPSSESELGLNSRDVLSLRESDQDKESSETEDTSSEKDLLLSLTMRTLKLSRLPEILLELTLATSTDLTFLNLLQEEPSEDLSFGLRTPSRLLTTFTEPTRLNQARKTDTPFKETLSQLPMLPDSSTQMLSNPSLEPHQPTRSFIQERRTLLPTKEP